MGYLLLCKRADRQNKYENYDTESKLLYIHFLNDGVHSKNLKRTTQNIKSPIDAIVDCLVAGEGAS